MEVIGLILMLIGAAVGFGARRLVIGKYNAANNDEEDRDFLELIEKGTVYLKFFGFAIVIIGFLFIFL